MKKYILIITSIIQLSSCSEEITSFVRNGTRTQQPTAPSTTTPTTPSTSTKNPYGYKITGAANQAEGTTVKSSFALTTNQQTLSGNQVKAKITFSQNRPNTN